MRSGFGTMTHRRGRDSYAQPIGLEGVISYQRAGAQGQVSTFDWQDREGIFHLVVANPEKTHGQFPSARLTSAAPI